MDLHFFVTLGIVLVIVGVIVIVLTIISASSHHPGKGKAKAAGIIIIGPIPIIFGTDKKSVKEVIWLALALTIAAIIAITLYYLLLR